MEPKNCFLHPARKIHEKLTVAGGSALTVSLTVNYPFFTTPITRPRGCPGRPRESRGASRGSHAFLGDRGPLKCLGAQGGVQGVPGGQWGRLGGLS